MRFPRVIPCLLLTVGIAAAQPVISNVFNAASNVTQGLPNSALAQGSIFTVQGDNLGPTTAATATPAFQSASLGGSSISVTVGSTTVNALMYYASAGQLSALLPSSTPTGSGTMTVSFQGSASTAFVVNVVANNLGLFTISENGSGAVIATYPDYGLVSAIPGTGTLADTCTSSGQYCPYTYAGAALPGDVITLWATGLGPVSGNESAGAGLGQSITTSSPLQLWIGGVSVPQITYQGRSGCCVGEDQIQFTVPGNLPTGCAVPIMVQIGSLVSNTALIPIGSSSRSCTPQSPALTSSIVSTVTTSPGPIDVATVEFGREINTVNSSGVFYADYGLAEFGQYSVSYLGQSSQPTILTSLDSPPAGTCVAYNLGSGGNTSFLTAVSGADPGTITVTAPSPNPPVNMTNKGGTPQTYESVFSPLGTYFSAGQYTISNNGGRDIGKFSIGFTIVGPAPTWSSSNQSNLLMNGVTRANGLTITWTPGSAAANYDVFIVGTSYTATATASPGASFQCMVPASAGTFTVPSNVLLALPTGGMEIDFKPALIPKSFSAPVVTSGASPLPGFAGFFGFSYQSSIFPSIN